MNDHNVLVRNLRKCLFDAVLSERLSLFTIFLKYIFYKVRRCFEYILKDRDYWYSHFGSLFSLEGATADSVDADADSWLRLPLR